MPIDALYFCFHPYELHWMCSNITTYHTHKYSDYVHLFVQGTQ
jgi:hypothetical protein